MTAAVRILIDQRADVLKVPNQALRYAPSAPGKAAEPPSSEAQVVWALRGGRPTAVPVDVGLEDDSFTEIVSGDLRPGDEVITAEQSPPATRTAAPRLRF